MLKKLSTHVGNGKLISIYADTDDPESFAVGFLIQINKNNILLNLVNRAGEETGLYLFNTKNVFMFSYEEDYFEKIEKLFKIKNQQRRNIPNLDSNLVASLFKYAFKNHLIVEVNNDYMGFIENFTDDVLEMKLIDNCGNKIGISNIDMDKIDSIKFQSRYLNDIELLVNSSK